MSSQTLNISLPKELIQQLDIVAKNQYRNRSELIREAVRVYLFDATKWERIFTSFEKSAKKTGYTNDKKINDMMYEIRHGKKKNTS